MQETGDTVLRWQLGMRKRGMQGIPVHVMVYKKKGGKKMGWMESFAKRERVKKAEEKIRELQEDYRQEQENGGL